MKNAIYYYYNIDIEELYSKDNYYYFNYHDDNYRLVIYNLNLKNDRDIYNLNQELVFNNIMVHEIILNKDNNVVTMINNIPYILYKIYVNSNKKYDLGEIEYLASIRVNYQRMNNDGWDILWSKKIDYFEYQINQNGKKYPIIVDSFGYFVGLAENAISYYKNTILELNGDITDGLVLEHRRLKVGDMVDELYNPLNIILDHKSRDLAEYIKNSFFMNDNNVFNYLDIYFSRNYYSEYGIRLLYARVLYPSFYFDLYEDIILGKKEEKEILNIVKNIDNYQRYLYQIYLYLSRYYKIPAVEWLKKTRI